MLENKKMGNAKWVSVLEKSKIDVQDTWWTIVDHQFQQKKKEKEKNRGGI